MLEASGATCETAAARAYHRKFTICQTILRPILEGLALFAEHDLIPNRYLGLFSSLTTLFCHNGDSQQDEDRKAAALVTLLKQTRTQSDYQTRLCSMLSDPLSGGHLYLLGYSLIQSFAAKARTESSAVASRHSFWVC
jgi:hypothetical protein